MNRFSIIPLSLLLTAACGGDEPSGTGDSTTTDSTTTTTDDDSSSTESTDTTTDDSGTGDTGDTGDGCAGSLGCECGPGGFCGPGLICLSDICVVDPAGTPMCGNGNLDPGEECDLGVLNDDTGLCKSDCTAAYCGDGFVGPGEACDDGNPIDTDDCTTTCALPTCGDGAVQGAEECDDANSSNSDACLNSCIAATCGDGLLQVGVEECDDGNTFEGDFCDNECKLIVGEGCGDGTLEAGELCYGPPASVIVANPAGLAAGFFNAPNPGDIAVADSGTGQIRAYSGEVGTQAEFPPDPNFAIEIDTGGNSDVIAHAAQADLDGDGLSDIISINGSNSGPDGSIMWGTGNSLMFANGELQGMSLPTNPARYVFPAKLSLGGNATFDDAVIVGEHYVVVGEGDTGGNIDYGLTNLPDDFHATAGCAGDINGDGTPEAIIIDTGSSELIVMPYIGQGQFSFNEDPPDPVVGFRWGLPFQSRPRRCATGDLDGDGTDEVIVTQWNEEGCNYALDPNICPWNTIILLDAQASSDDPTGFELEIGYPVGKAPWAVDMVDMDGDGNLDVVTVNAAQGEVSIVHGDGEGWFDGQTRIDTGAAGGTPTEMVIADLNSDGVNDFVITRPDNQAVSVVISTD